MVNVSDKVSTKRKAHARCQIILPDNVLYQLNAVDENISKFSSKKGPIVATSVIAGVMAAKRTSDLIPFCHQVPLDGKKYEKHFYQFVYFFLFFLKKNHLNSVIV